MKRHKSPTSRPWFQWTARCVLSLVFAATASLVATPSHAQEKEITIAYQQIVDPWVVGIANGSIEKATGYKINWRQFESGAKVATALASGSGKLRILRHGVIGVEQLRAVVGDALADEQGSETPADT